MTKFSRITTSRWARGSWAALGLTLSLLAAWASARHVNWTEVIGAMMQANYWWLLAAFISLPLTTLVKTLRWRVLFIPRPKSVSLTDMFASLAVGVMLNIALPGRFGDVGRAALIGRAGLSRVTALVTVAAEKYIELVAVVVLATLLLPFMPWPTWARSSLWIITLFVIVGLLGLILLLTFHQTLEIEVERVGRRHFPAWVESVLHWMRLAWQGLAALRSPADMANVAGWTALAWALAVLTNWLVAQAMGISGTWVMWTFVLIVTQLGVAVPSAPGNIGVFHYLMVLSLGLFGVDRTQALAYAVVLHVLVMLAILITGLLAWPWAARVSDKKTA